MRTARIRVVGYLSIDCVQRDGIVHQRLAGGAALYAALGARHGGASVAIDATVGADYPRPWLDRLDALGIDVSRVRQAAGDTRTTTLRYGSDGRRSSPHHRQGAWWERTQALAPAAQSLHDADVVVACPMPVDTLAQLLQAAAAAGVPVVADTSEAFVGDDPQRLLALLGRLAVFAPSCEETRLLLPQMDDDAAARWLAGQGPHILQKRGARGALAVAGLARSALPISAPTAIVVDPTGAGDATVGALAAHWGGGADFPAAAQAALVTGALATTGIGPSALGLQTGESVQRA